MKKTILICFLLFVTAMHSKAQNIEITPFAGYNFADRFSIHGGNARIGDGFSYGGTISIITESDKTIEMSYLRTEMTVSAYSSYWNFDFSDPSSSNYILLGGSQLFPVNDKFVPYAGAQAGMLILASRNDTYDNIIKLAFGIDAGLKYYLSERIGLRLQANLNFPLTDVGANLWWSSGGGTSVGAGGSIPFVQFGFTGGLIFKIK